MFVNLAPDSDSDSDSYSRVVLGRIGDGKPKIFESESEYEAVEIGNNNIGNYALEFLFCSVCREYDAEFQ